MNKREIESLTDRLIKEIKETFKEEGYYNFNEDTTKEELLDFLIEVKRTASELDIELKDITLKNIELTPKYKEKKKQRF